MNNILKLKETIKTLAAEQRQLKTERKASYKGKRKNQPLEAAAMHRYNRIRLRHLYFIYAELRGKPTEHLIPKSEDKQLSQRLLDKIRKEFEPLMADITIDG